MPTPDESREPRQSGLDKLGTLITVGATLLGVVAALGLPAVAVQYHRLNVPLQLITKEQALRAGILPTLALLVVVLVAYLSWQHLDWVRRKFAAGTTEQNVRASVEQILIPLRMLLTSGVLLLATGRFAVRAGNYVVARYHRRPQIGFIIVEGTAVIAFIAFLHLFRKLKVFAPNVERKTPSNNTLFDLATSVLGVSEYFAITTATFLLWTKWFARKWFVPQDASVNAMLSSYFDVIMTCATVALFGASLVLLAEGADCLLVEQPTVGSTIDFKKRGQISTAAGLLFFYLAFITFYSSQMYQNIDYATGGGRPTRATLWVDKKQLPTTAALILNQSRIQEDGELMRWENVYIVYVDPEVVVVTATDWYFSSSLVLRRESVKAVTT
jgi:hypothetical protein